MNIQRRRAHESSQWQVRKRPAAPPQGEAGQARLPPRRSIHTAITTVDQQLQVRIHASARLSPQSLPSREVHEQIKVRCIDSRCARQKWLLICHSSWQRLTKSFSFHLSGKPGPRFALLDISAKIYLMNWLVTHALIGIAMISHNLQRTVNRDAQSKRKLLSQKQLPVTPPIAVAAELIVSLLALSASGELPDSQSALMRRFPNGVIAEGFAHLRLLDYVLHGSQQRPKDDEKTTEKITGQRFLLSEGFHNLNQVIFVACRSLKVTGWTSKFCILSHNISVHSFTKSKHPDAEANRSLPGLSLSIIPCNYFPP